MPYRGGNHYGKYTTRHPLERWVVQRFVKEARALVDLVGPRTIHEVGCGEGFLLRSFHAPTRTLRGSDRCPEIIQLARAMSQGMAHISFEVRDLSALSKVDTADLVVCMEVLEHLTEPEHFFESIEAMAPQYVLLSVPEEPLWRALNLLRGRYWSRWGNTPGHVQHWSAKGFRQWVARYLDIVETRRSIPWTLVLARPRRPSLSLESS